MILSFVVNVRFFFAACVWSAAAACYVTPDAVMCRVQIQPVYSITVRMIMMPTT